MNRRDKWLIFLKMTGAALFNVGVFSFLLFIAYNFHSTAVLAQEDEVVTQVSILSEKAPTVLVQKVEASRPKQITAIVARPPSPSDFPSVPIKSLLVDELLWLSDFQLPATQLEEKNITPSPTSRPKPRPNKQGVYSLNLRQESYDQRSPRSYLFHILGQRYGAHNYRGVFTQLQLRDEGLNAKLGANVSHHISKKLQWDLAGMWGAKASYIAHYQLSSKLHFQKGPVGTYAKLTQTQYPDLALTYMGLGLNYSGLSTQQFTLELGQHSVQDRSDMGLKLDWQSHLFSSLSTRMIWSKYTEFDLKSVDNVTELFIGLTYHRQKWRMDLGRSQESRAFGSDRQYWSLALSYRGIF